MGVFDNIQPSTQPAASGRETLPTQPGGVFAGITPPPAQPGVFSTVTPKPASSPYFQAKLPSGTFAGISDQQDTSGAPYFAYRTPGATATTTDLTRVATTFDPTKPQKLTMDQLHNGRMPDTVSAPIKKALGGSYSDELDHTIALELAGSNNPANLKIEPGRVGMDPFNPLASKESATFDKEENQLAQQVIQGKMSLWQAQYKLASDKAAAGDNNTLPFVDQTTPKTETPTTTDLAKNTLLGLWPAAKTVGKYLYDQGMQTILPGITPEEANSPKFLATQVAPAIIPSVEKIGAEFMQHPAVSLAQVGQGTVLGMLDFMSNAIVHIPGLVPPKEQESTIAALNDTFKKTLFPEGQGDIGQGFENAGQATIPILASAGASAAAAPLGAAAEFAAGAGGFAVAGQTQLPTDATIEQRAQNALDSLVQQGLFTAGSYAYHLAKGAVVQGAKTAYEALPSVQEAQRGFAKIPGMGESPEEGASKAKQESGAEAVAQPAKSAPTRNRAELEQELEDMKGYLAYTDEAVQNHPAKDLLKYYGGRDPHTTTLDDIFARNVEKKTGAKSAQLDSIVTERGYNTPTDAHEGVLQYLQLREQNKELHAMEGKLKEELATTKTYEDKRTADERVSAQLAAKGERARQQAQAEYERTQRLQTVKENAAPKELNLTRQVFTDAQGRERLTADPLANPSNFYQRMAEIEKADPERSLNEMRHISREDIARAILTLKEKEIKASSKRAAIEKSRGELPYTISKLQKVKNTLYPISTLPEEIRTIATDWQRGDLSAVEKANAEYKELPGAQTKIGKDGTRELIKKSPLDRWMPTDEAVREYTAIQHGKYSPVRDIFDRLYHYAERVGLDVPYRKNYLPQVYKERLPEVKVAALQYMRDHGVDEDVAEAYVQGVMQLPMDVSLRLKINPSFVEHKAFPDYSVAAKYGLHPRFNNIADLVANYRYELEKSINNKQFTTKLIDTGKLLPAGIAPDHWQHVTSNFVRGDLYAPPELARMLNNLYKDEASMGVFDTAVHYLGLVSRKAQEISLSGAIPYTNIHFFSFGQLIKELTAGNFKAVAPFVRSNSLQATEKWFRSNQMYSDMMARQGIDISSRMGSIKQIYNTLLHDATWYEKVGIKFREAFLDKSFGTFLPSLYLQVFKDTYHTALTHGMSELDAEKFAGEVTQKNFGLLGTEARAQATRDSLSGIFFAPVFRESVFGTLANAARSVTTELRNPTFYRNRRLVGGMLLSFAMYQLFNKNLNGQYTWQNPNGHEFELRIPLADGNNMYIPWMPSFLALPRSVATAGISAVKGDAATAVQQAGSVFALPLQVAFQILANKDYFGRPIYAATDTAAQTYGKIAAHIGLSVSHPYVKAVVDMVMKKQPIYQTLSEAATLPLKFQTNKSISQSAFYNTLQRAQTKNAQSKGDISALYDQVQQLAADGKTTQAQAIVDGLTDEQYKQYTSYKTAQKTKTTSQEKAAQFGQYQDIQNLIKQGNVSEAKKRVDAMSDEKYRIYVLLKKQFGDATNPN